MTNYGNTGGKAMSNREQLLVNIEAIIDTLWRVPGVTAIDVQEPEADDMWEKKLFVTFAGCDEPVGMELF